MRYSVQKTLLLLLAALILLTGALSAAAQPSEANEQKESGSSTQNDLPDEPEQTDSSVSPSSVPSSNISSETLSSSSTPSETSSQESSSSSNASTPPVGSSSIAPPSSRPDTTMNGLYVEANGKDISNLFTREGHRITGTVPYEVSKIQVSATPNSATAVVSYTYRSTELAVGENRDFVVITITDGSVAHYYLSVTRSPQAQSSSRPSSTQPSSDNMIIDWKTSSRQPPSALEEEESSSSEESPSSDPTAVVSHHGSSWMTPTAIILFLLGGFGILFVIGDILYTQGILKKWIVPTHRQAHRNPSSEPAANPAPDDMTDISEASAESKTRLPIDELDPEEKQSWEDFFRNQ